MTGGGALARICHKLSIHAGGDDTHLGILRVDMVANERRERLLRQIEPIRVSAEIRKGDPGVHVLVRAKHQGSHL